MTKQPRKSAKNTRKGCFTHPQDRRLAIEPLESRLMLDSSGFITGDDVYLTLSFAADGTAIADQSNSLAARFDAIAPASEWQDAILRAFQTWAVETNGDIGVVSDNGDPFGSPGPSQDDGRFGDIRIGAIAMSPEVGAISVPVDGLVSGSWFADVVFNTAYNYTTIDDIFAIALHEAGNVFGLEDSSDPNSPLFTGGTPTGLPPTATDLADLHQRHGIRAGDSNEVDNGLLNNDSFANATQLKLVEAGLANEGTAPSIVYGDITNDLDVDFFELDTPGDYTGPATIQVRSNGISLLAPTVSLYDETQQLLSQAVSTSSSGDLLTFSLPSVAPDQTYFIKVAGTAPGLFGVGGFSLVATFDGINQISQSEIDSIAGGQFRFLEQDDISKFFDAVEGENFGDDAHTDDTSSSASGLKTTAGFVASTHYEVIASIADTTDVDYYSFKSPNILPVPQNIMTVIVRSLDAGGLIPVVSVFDNNGLPVSSTILANGAGEYIVQVVGVNPGKTYQIKVEASNHSGPFNTGNYSFTTSFGSQATQLLPMSAGTVGNGTTQNNHTLHIGRPQLFHLALQVDPATTNSPTAVVTTIKNDVGEVVYQIAAVPGDTRSREAVFLAAGTYTVEVVPFTLDGSVSPALTYSLLGTAISDPFVGDPNDPTNNPFACTGAGQQGLFCYPGGFVSPNPFLWEGFINSFTNPPQSPNLPTLVTLLFGDWWTWVWNQSGVNGPPFGSPDAIQVQETSAALAPLLVGPTGSVLGNDIDPENDPIVAILQTEPTHGSLSLATDGTFVYVPDVGFSGEDKFTYTAFDFTQESAATTVTLIVGNSGDFNASGEISGLDFLTWQQSFGTATGAVLTTGDSNFDGNVDSQDLSIWQQQFSLLPGSSPSLGDANTDGIFDGLDFLAWQQGFGTQYGAFASTGDADADRDVDSQDLSIWQQQFSLLPGSTPSLGDANTDGNFDGLDFLAWQQGFGTQYGAFASTGDADADRDVDAQDLAAWEGNFGTVAALAAAAVSGSSSIPITANSTTQLPLASSPLTLPPGRQSPEIVSSPVSRVAVTNVVLQTTSPVPGLQSFLDNGKLFSNAFLESPYETAAQQAQQPLLLEDGKLFASSAASRRGSETLKREIENSEINSTPVLRNKYRRSQADARDQVFADFVFADFYANRYQRIRSALLDTLDAIGVEPGPG